VAISGCAYRANTKVSPALDIYSNYDNKIPGRFALYVDADDLKSDVKMTGYNCAAYSYPVDASATFTSSVKKTFENLVDEIDIVQSPLDRTQISSGGYRGLIMVKAEDLAVDLRVIPGFFSAEIEADATIIARLTVEGDSGRIMGTSVEGDKTYRTDAGFACDGGATAVGRAVNKAMKETLERLGERLSNSVRLRS